LYMEFMIKIERLREHRERMQAVVASGSVK
jgi:hypothetical protein